MKRTSLRLASLAMALFTVLSLAHALAEAGYTPYPTPRTAVSEDSTIYLRDIPVKDTDGAVELRHMEGKTVSVLGEDATGKYFDIEYEGKKGFVCKICGYVYEGDTLPADFICPLCKHGAEDFEPLK